MTPSQIEQLHQQPIQIAVVGHTNAGKTTTVRTLVCNENVGIVSNKPNVTDYLETYPITSPAGKNRYTVYDTAGFSGFSRRMRAYKKENSGASPTLKQFQEFLVAQKEAIYQHVASSLQKIGESDVMILVIDTTVAPDDERKEELVFLQRCGTPMIVSLNCLYGRGSNESHWQQWLEQLKDLGISTVVKFDAHRLTLVDEKNLLVLIQGVLQQQFHKDFIEYRIEQERCDLDDRDQKAVDIAKKCVVDLKRFRKVHHDVEAEEFDRIEKALAEEFEKELQDKIYDWIVRAVDCYQISKRHLPNDLTMAKQGQARGETSWIPTKTQTGVGGGAVATVAGMEALGGFITLGIPTALTVLACYTTGKIYEARTNPKGTSVVVELNDDQVVEFASILLNVVHEARLTGRGALPGPRDPVQTRPLRITNDSKVKLEPQLREALVQYAHSPTNSTPSLDSALISVLKH